MSGNGSSEGSVASLGAAGDGGSMIFIVTGERENGPVSTTCQSALSAFRQAQKLADDGAWNVLIDADGQEYAPVDFQRRFIEPGPVRTSGLG
jgi:hypothetical protein